MPHLRNGGFQSASHGSERRADFDLMRRQHEMEHTIEEQETTIASLQTTISALQTQVAALPRGVVNLLTPVDVVSAVSVPVSTVTPLTVAESVTFSTGRRYRVVGFIRALSSPTSALVNGDVGLYDGATDLYPALGGHVHFSLPTGAAYAYAYAEYLVDGANQTYTNFRFSMQAVNVLDAFLSPNSRFYIEDVGAL